MTLFPLSTCETDAENMLTFYQQIATNAMIYIVFDYKSVHQCKNMKLKTWEHKLGVMVSGNKHTSMTYFAVF